MMLTSCKKDEKTEPIRELKVNKQTITVVIGEETEVKITDGNGGYKLSSDDNVKTSIKKDVITIEGVKLGKSTVVITDSKQKTTTINVTVTAKNVTLALSKISVKKDESVKVDITTGSGFYSAKVSKGNDLVKAKIEGNKLIITAIKKGEAEIIVTDSKTKKITKITVTVTETTPDIELSSNKVSIKKGNKIEVKIIAGSGNYTATANNDNISVKITDSKVVITGNKTGKAKITVKDTKTNKTAEITVTVTETTPDIKLSTNNVEVKKGENIMVDIIAGSGNYTAQANNDNVTVQITNSNLIITGNKAGNTKVTVKDTETNKTAEVTVKVIETVPDIKLSTDNVEVKKGENVEVNITAGSGNYTAQTDNDNVTVQITGDKVLITGSKAGNAIVTVKDTETNKTAKITVTVSETTPDIKLSTDNVEVNKGENVEVEITAGSGNYTAQANNDNVTVQITDSKVIITGSKAGNSIVTVTDTETNKTAEINVVVNEVIVDNLAISEDGFIDYQGEKEIRLYNKIVLDINTPDKQEKTVQITSGSGDYEITIESGSNLINAVIEGGNTIKISSTNEEHGEAIVVLKDKVSSQEIRIKVRVVIPLKMSNTSTMEIYANLENTEVTFLNYFTSEDANYDHIQVSSSDDNIATVTKHINEPYMGIKVQAGNTLDNATLTITDLIRTITIEVEVKQAPALKITDALSGQEVSGTVDLKVGTETMFIVEGSGVYELTPNESDLFTASIDNFGYLSINPIAAGTVDLTIKDISSNETKILTLNITDEQPFAVSFSSNDGATFDNTPIEEAGQNMEGTITMSVGQHGTFTLTGGSGKYSAGGLSGHGDAGTISFTDPDGTGICEIEALQAGTFYLRLMDYDILERKYYKIVVQ